MRNMSETEDMGETGETCETCETGDKKYFANAPGAMSGKNCFARDELAPKNIVRRRSAEVLSPAGNLKAVRAAADFGADAVYCSGKMFGMRTAPKNLTLEEIQQAADYVHARGARLYITCNVLPTNPEIDGIEQYLGALGEIGADAVIVTDIGIMMLAKKVAPNLEIHISTQAGVVNWLSAKTLYELGAKRVVLARELNLDTIREIRAKTPKDLEIECFVHGSMCMAFSGRCVISSYMTGRDGNHGECAQPCRWKYAVVEQKRPGQYFPIEQTKDGAYLFNSQDMCMLEHLPDLIEAGVDSLKIEGRAKSAYYVAAMTNAYKTAVNSYYDAIESGGSASDAVLPQWVKEEPFKVSHREYSTGFYYPENSVSQNTDRGGYYRDWLVVGDVVSWENGRMTFIGHNKIVDGQMIEIIQPASAPVRLNVEQLRDEQGNDISMANHPTYVFSLKCDYPIVSGAVMRAKAAIRTLKAE